MGLEEYEKKRNFSATSEPAPDKGRAEEDGRTYVVQKHAASQLHYDFRLELGGVLLSWAVPKGPSLDPSEKRLAVRVEDHPVDYADFEGVIPADEYGGGTVMLWDRGTWEPEGDPDAGLEDGELKFTVHGERLSGGYVLVRMKGARGGGGKNWLLIKHKDEHARRENAFDPRGEYTDSVASGRAMDAIAEEEGGAGGGSQKGGGSGQDNNGGGGRESATVAGVRLTHPDRVLYPGAGHTKEDVARYFEEISRHVLPHVVHRPLSVLRCPKGRDGDCFFQKHLTDGMPDAVRGVEVEEKNGSTRTYLEVRTLEGLVALVQMGALEIHPWGARSDRVDRPDRVVFDLDPGEGEEFSAVVDGARRVRDFLEELELASFVRTTGGKGLHVVVPLVRRSTWEEAAAFARAVAEEIAAAEPDRYLAAMSKEERKGRVFIDHFRNTRGATSVAAFSPRARPDAPVSVPLRWDELGPGLAPDKYTLGNVRRRLGSLRGDPWKGFFEARQTLTKEMRERLGL